MSAVIRTALGLGTVQVTESRGRVTLYTATYPPGVYIDLTVEQARELSNALNDSAANAAFLAIEATQ